MVPPHLKKAAMRAQATPSSSPPVTSPVTGEEGLLTSSSPVTSPATQHTATKETAIVPFQARKLDGSEQPSSKFTAADAFNLKHTHTSPRELIQHESIRSLVKEVAELRQRCELLETSNTKLKQSVELLDQKHRDGVARVPLTESNLTGYGESGSDSTTTLDSRRQRGHSEHEEQTRTQFRAIAEILEGYDKRLNEQAERRTVSEARIQELTDYKRKSEALFSSLRTELEALDISDAGRGKSGDASWEGQQSAGQVAEEMMERHGRLVARFNELEAQIEHMQANDVHGDGMTSGEPRGSDFKHEVSQQLDILTGRVDRLRESLKQVQRKEKNEHFIDNANSTDELYAMFRNLHRVLAKSNPQDTQKRRAGVFEGTFDELWPLRDRVVYRLATWDDVEKAFAEAEKVADDMAG